MMKSLSYEVTTVKTSSQIDWLSITLPADQNWRQFLPLTELINRGKGRHGYAHRWQDALTGATVETGSLDFAMGHHFTLSGDVLLALRRASEMDDLALCQRIALFDAKVSRIDLALDCYGATFMPRNLATSLTDGTAHIPARTWRYINGYREGISGETVDTGSVSSDRRFRFYDKRAEKRVKDGEAWVRLELQLRRLYAKAAVSAVIEHGAPLTIRGAIGGYLTWRNPDYTTALSGAEMSLALPSRSDTNRQKWLLGQVAWALASEIIDNGAFLGRFLTCVGAAIEARLAK